MSRTALFVRMLTIVVAGPAVGLSAAAWIHPTAVALVVAPCLVWCLGWSLVGSVVISERHAISPS